MNTFASIIPAPAKIECSNAGEFPLEQISNFHIAEPFAEFADRIKAMFSYFSYNITVGDPAEAAALAIIEAPLPPEAFAIEITPDKVVIKSGSKAIRQMICLFFKSEL